MKRDTAKILLDAGYTNVFVVDPPETISDYILISASGGFGLTTADAGFSRPTIQILVADKDPDALDTKIQAINKYLIELNQTEIRDILSELYTWDEWTTWDQFNRWDTYLRKDNSEVYEDKLLGYDTLSEYLDLGRDEQLRYVQSINFIVYFNIN